MKPIFRPFGCFLCLAVTIAFMGCNTSNDAVITITNGVVETNGVIPEKETLIDNLEDAGYTITNYTSIDGSALTIDRLIAEKGNKFIDITYGLSDKDANTIFDSYCDRYKTDSDYYILARNLNYVYCVSDKKTFSKAGFKSTSCIGEQYINK